MGKERSLAPINRPRTGDEPVATRIAIGVEYDGAPFAGWQSQRGVPTVQDALEAAIGEVAGTPVRLHAAGRTDQGVHATLQVAHFDCTVARPSSAWVRGVNSRLPKSIAVRWAVAVERTFHARFSAIRREYTYVLLNRDTRPGLLAGRVGWFHRPLSVAAMREAAAQFVGRHDFSAFRAAECQAKSPVRTLERLDVEQADELVLFHFRADAFLHHMVRNVVGTLVYVGKGSVEPASVAALLAGRDRTRAAPTFAPDGLYLVGVEYPDALALPERRCPVRIAAHADQSVKCARG